MKYKITNNVLFLRSVILYRIQALKDFELINGKKINAGEYGGWIESSQNLSQYGNCWIDDDACVYDDAFISGNALVCDSSCVCESASIRENAIISGSAIIKGNAVIEKQAKVSCSAIVEGHSIITDSAQIKDLVVIEGSATIGGKSVVSQNVTIDKKAIAKIMGNVSGNIKICGLARVLNSSSISGNFVLNGVVNIINGSKVYSKEKQIIDGYTLFNKQRYPLYISKTDINFDNEHIVVPIHYPQKITVHIPSMAIYNTNDNDIISVVTPVFCWESANKTFSSLEQVYNYSQKELHQLLQKTKFLNKTQQREIPLILNFLSNANNFKNAINHLKTCFVKQLIAFSDEKEKEKISFYKYKIDKIIDIYITAELLGIMFFGVDFCKNYKNENYDVEEINSKWVSSLCDMLSNANIDIINKKIDNLYSITSAYNEEMINAVGNICGFSLAWRKTILIGFESIKENNLKLYC